MIVHLTTSKSVLIRDIDLLRKLVILIQGEGHKMASKWIEPAYEKLSKEKRNKEELRQARRQSTEEVAKADVVIAEVTETSFGVGYSIAEAVHQKKPTLLLSRIGTHNDTMAMGLDNAIVRFHFYNEDNVEHIVKDFLKANSIANKDLRFNFFIDRPIYNYLRWASIKTGKTKSEIVREIIKDQIKMNQ